MPSNLQLKEEIFGRFIMSENNATQEFSKLFEESQKELVSYKRGDQVSGEIIKISGGSIVLSLKARQDAFADIIEYQNKKGVLEYKVGDIIEGFVLRVDENVIEIGKALSSDHAANMKLEEAKQADIPVQGKVLKAVKGGFLVSAMGKTGFCPYSHLSLSRIENEDAFIGKSFEFEIIKLENGGKDFVLSRKGLLLKEAKAKKEEALKKLSVGAVVKGKVESIKNYAAFLDLGGISGFLHISNLAWGKVSHPSKMLKVGDTVEVKVMKIDGDKIDLSIKDLTVDPMQEAVEKYKEGDVVTCKVVQNMQFGSFVELSQGVQGLIPISELSWGKRIKKADEVLSVGDVVDAQVMNVDKDKRKISLSFKNLKENPWQKVDEVATEGEPVKGVIEGVSKFGVFVEIVEGITGLLPNDKMRAAKILYDENDIGKEVTLKVASIDKVKRKLSLDPVKLPKGYYIQKEKANSDKGSAKDWQKYAKSSVAPEEDPDSPFAGL